MRHQLTVNTVGFSTTIRSTAISCQPLYGPGLEIEQETKQILNVTIPGNKVQTTLIYVFLNIYRFCRNKLSQTTFGTSTCFECAELYKRKKKR